MNILIYWMGEISHATYMGIVNSPLFHIVFVVLNIIAVSFIGGALVGLSMLVKKWFLKAKGRAAEDDWDGSPFTREEFHNAVVGSMKVVAISSAIAAAFYLVANILDTGWAHFQILDEYRYFIIEHGIITVLLAGICLYVDKISPMKEEKKKAELINRVLHDTLLDDLKKEDTAIAVRDFISEEVKRGNEALALNADIDREVIHDEHIVLAAFVRLMYYVTENFDEQQFNWLYNTADSYGEDVSRHGNEIMNKIMDFLEGYNVTGQKDGNDILNCLNRDEIRMFELVGLVIGRKES